MITGLWGKHIQLILFKLIDSNLSLLKIETSPTHKISDMHICPYYWDIYAPTHMYNTCRGELPLGWDYCRHNEACLFSCWYIYTEFWPCVAMKHTWGQFVCCVGACVRLGECVFANEGGEGEALCLQSSEKLPDVPFGKRSSIIKTW